MDGPTYLKASLDPHFEPAFLGNFPPNYVREDYATLCQAIRSGNEALVQHLVNNNAPVNRLLDFPSLTPLHLAVQSRSLPIIKILLNEGADVNAKCWDGDTPITSAAKIENSSVIDLLLSQNVNNCGDANGLSHLHIACMRNQVDIVKKLITMSQGSNLNERVRENSMVWQGYTPLHHAVDFGCAETAEYLLECGADLKAKDSRGLTPLHLSDWKRDGKMIDLLLAAHKKEIKNPFSKIGLSHFHIACTRDDTSIVERFLKSGVDIDLEASGYQNGPWSRWRPLHFAIYYRCDKVVQFLVKAGAQFSYPIGNLLKYEYMMGNELIHDLLTTEEDEAWRTHRESYGILNGFLRAFAQDNVGTVSLSSVIKPMLENLSPDDSLYLSTPIWTGSTILHLAVRYRNEYIVRTLMSNGADFMIQDDEGQTPLHIAFYHNQNRIIDVMASKLSIKIENLIDSKGLTIFHILCTTSVLRVVENCLHYSNVDVNAQVGSNSERWAGFTPLHFACMCRQAGIVKLLLDNHADVLITNGINLNPYDLTINQLIIDFPSQHMAYECFQIIEAILRSLPPDIKTLNTRGISILHARCFDIESESKSLSLLQQCLTTHQNEINNAIDLGRKHFYNKCTPLHLAMRFRNWERAQLMLQNGADPLILNGDGNTPLECALRYGSNSTDLAKYPGFFSLEINQTLKPSNFHMACGVGLLVAVTRVLKITDKKTKEILLTFCDHGGNTPLHSALQLLDTGSLRRLMTRLLVENGAKVNARNYELRTPLYFAYRFGDVEIVRLLIDHGAEVNPRDVWGCIVLENFIENKSAEEIAFLLNNGFDINTMDREKQTCLNQISKSLFIEIAEDPENKFKGPICLIIMLKHVKKLELIGAYISEEIKLAYIETLPRVSRHFEETAFVLDCKTELESMAALSIDRYTTLRDILSKSSNKMATHCENVELLEMVRTDAFLQRFPIYGSLIRLQIKNGAARRSLLTKAKKSLVSLIGLTIPQACLEMILRLLCETDLKNIISSEELDTS